MPFCEFNAYKYSQIVWGINRREERYKTYKALRAPSREKGLPRAAYAVLLTFR